MNPNTTSTNTWTNGPSNIEDMELSHNHPIDEPLSADQEKLVEIAELQQSLNDPSLVVTDLGVPPRDYSDSTVEGLLGHLNSWAETEGFVFTINSTSRRPSKRAERCDFRCCFSKCRYKITGSKLNGDDFWSVKDFGARYTQHSHERGPLFVPDRLSRKRWTLCNPKNTWDGVFLRCCGISSIFRISMRLSTSGPLSRDLPSVHGISISSTMKRQRLADSFLDQITSPENLPSRDGVFPSRSDLFSFLNSFAASRGFAFVIGDAYNRTTRQCVCHKTPTPHIAPVYKTSQRGTGCTYRGREDEMGMWHLYYPIEPNLDRNHDFPGLSTIYPTLCRLSE